jgi:hypothetical protein
MEFINKSGLPDKLKMVFDKQRETEKKLGSSVAGMKDAPAPKGVDNGR